jgi:hypothetical protein
VITPARSKMWRKVLALVPVLLVVASVPGQALLRCRMDGALRAACCCPAEQDASPAPAAPAMSGPGCCDRVIVSRDLSPIASPPAAGPALDLAVPVVLPAYAALIAPDRVRAPRAVQRGGPARRGPDLLALKQTYLI